MMQSNEEWKAQYGALIGLDWADEEHYYHQADVNTGRVRAASLVQKADVIDEWATELGASYSKPVAICLEQSKGVLMNALMKYPHIHLYPLDGKKLRRFRESSVTSGDKDDAKDAEQLWEYLFLRGQKLRVWKPDTEETRLLGMLNEERRNAVDARTAATNEALAVLKGYFPLAVSLLSYSLKTPLAVAFFKKWLTYDELRKARPSTIQKFFFEHGCHNAERNRERAEEVERAKPLVTDAAVIEAGSLRISRLVGQIQVLNDAIKRVEKRIAELMDDHDDAEIFQSLPGAGPTLAPRLLVALGTDRDRWDGIKDIQCLHGIAPIRVVSGKTTQGVRFRWACAKFQRQSWVEFAEQTVKKCSWARAFYDKRKAEGIKIRTVHRELAFKWSRIIYRCWMNRVPYDDAKYLESLIRRQSPILEYMKQ